MNDLEKYKASLKRLEQSVLLTVFHTREAAKACQEAADEAEKCAIGIKKIVEEL